MDAKFEAIQNLIITYIDWVYLVVFMANAYIFKKMLAAILDIIVKIRYPYREADKNFVVFIIASLTAIPFYFCTDSDGMKLLVSATLGTSLYDWLLKYPIKWVEAKLKALYGGQNN